MPGAKASTIAVPRCTQSCLHSFLILGTPSIMLCMTWTDTPLENWFCSWIVFFTCQGGMEKISKWARSFWIG
jgi:hypothetical protein